MGTIMIKLKLIGSNRYALFGPKGNQISETYRGNKQDAKLWAKAWVSSFHNWGVDSKEIDDEEASGVPEQNI